MITYKAKTLEGKEVEGYYSHVYDDNTHYILTKTKLRSIQPRKFFGHEIDPSTLRILIKGKEYTPEQVEMLPELIDKINSLLHNGYVIKGTADNPNSLFTDRVYELEQLLNQLS